MIIVPQGGEEADAHHVPGQLRQILQGRGGEGRGEEGRGGEGRDVGNKMGDQQIYNSRTYR